MSAAGLADLWEQAGHKVTRLGRGGGDVSDAEVVLLACLAGRSRRRSRRCGAVSRAKTVIDATNLYGVVPPDGFPSNASS